MRRNLLIDLAAGFLLPLVPAVVLYGAFSTLNSADVIRDTEGIKLGGPAALYFVLLIVSFRQMNQWRKATDPLAKLRNDLVGKWDVEAVSSNDRHATSESSFRIEDDELILGGGSFVQEGKNIGEWTPDHIILDRHHDEVIFLYDLKDVAANAVSRGLMQLKIGGDPPNAMSGIWEVIGPNHHRGLVKFVKRGEG